MSRLQEVHCRFCRQTFLTFPKDFEAQQCDLCKKQGGLTIPGSEPTTHDFDSSSDPDQDPARPVRHCPTLEQGVESASLADQASQSPVAVSPDPLPVEALTTDFRWAVWSLVGWLVLIGAVNLLAGIILLASEAPVLSNLGPRQARVFGVLSLCYGGLLLTLTYHVGRGRMWATKTCFILFACQFLVSLPFTGQSVRNGQFLPLIFFVLVGMSFARVFDKAHLLRLATRPARGPLEARPKLHKLLTEGNVDALLAALHTECKDAQRGIVQALGSLGELAAPAVPLLLEILEGKGLPWPTEANRCPQCGRRVTIWNKAFGSRLCGACHNSSRNHPEKFWSSLQQFAAEALGQIGPPARVAIPALKRVSEYADLDLRNAASRALFLLEHSDL
jgi:hypothetical protein